MSPRIAGGAAIAALVLMAIAGCASITDRSRAAAVRPSAPPAMRLLLRLGERRIYLVDDDPTTPVESFPIAVGRKGWETPTGRYQVEEKIEYPDFDVVDPADRTRVLRTVPPGPTNPLGKRWIGIIVGNGWTIGIHGTPRPELLGQAVSHGCIRMHNADVVRIYDQVELGTPVFIEP